MLRRAFHTQGASRGVTHSALAALSGQASPSPLFRPAARAQSSVSFPCVDRNEQRSEALARRRRSEATPWLPLDTSQLMNTDPEGPEPAYADAVFGYETFHHGSEFRLDYGGTLPAFDLAYETWGELNADRTNAVLLHTGLSASSHAHSSAANPAEGWWEQFIGPGRALDTDKYYVICTNVLGGCYGSTGPGSVNPLTGAAYATQFPVLSVFDMVRAQLLLLTHLGIDRLYASVGSSMGGMQSLAAAHLAPERVGKVVSISGTARSSPSSIAMRHAQRSAIMSDPHWNRGFYYDGVPPHTGMKLARQIATITYRSGPEWEQRFGRRRRDLATSEASDHLPSGPVLCPDFLIETYIDHQGEQFCLKYDANSLIYVSKAMDLFDMSADALADLDARRAAAESGTLPSPACEGPAETPKSVKKAAKPAKKHISTLPSSHHYLHSLRKGLERITHPTLIMGVQSDTLFPIEQQREIADCLKYNGNDKVVYYELNQPWGHDTFLLDVLNIGSAIKGFLDTVE